MNSKITARRKFEGNVYDVKNVVDSKIEVRRVVVAVVVVVVSSPQTKQVCMDLLIQYVVALAEYTGSERGVVLEGRVCSSENENCRCRRRRRRRFLFCCCCCCLIAVIFL